MNQLYRIFQVLFVVVSIGMEMSAQVSQKGTVRIFNSGRSPLAGVQVMAYGAPATDTDSQGAFILEFSDCNPGMSIPLPEVYKKGYELVNSDVFDYWILSESRMMDMVMAETGVIEEARNRYYSISTRQYTEKNKALVEEINALYEEQKITCGERRRRLDELAAENMGYMQRIGYYADRLARINPDDVSDLEKQVLILAGDGKTEEAMELYEKSGILETIKNKAELKSRLSSEVRDLTERLYRYADLCILTGGRENEQKAYDTYTFIAEALPDDFRYAFNLATLKVRFMEPDAGEWLERSLDLAPDGRTVLIVINSCVSFALNTHNDIAMAEQYYRMGAELLPICQNSMPSGDYIVAYYDNIWNLVEILKKSGMDDNIMQICEEMARSIEDILESETNHALTDALKDRLANVYLEMSGVYSRKGNARKVIDMNSRMDSLLYNMGYDHQKLNISRSQAIMNLFNLFVNNYDLKSAMECVDNYVKTVEDMYRRHPKTYSFSCALANSVQAMLLLTYDPGRFPEVEEELERRCLDEFLLNDEQRTYMQYMAERCRILYYQSKGDMSGIRTCVTSLLNAADSLESIKPYQYINEVLYARLMYIEYLSLSEPEKALSDAMDLDSRYHTFLYDESILNSTGLNLANVLISGGQYELGAEYMEKVKESREKYISEHPDNLEMKINVSNAYNGLFIAYQKMGKDDLAMKYCRKAYSIMKDFYGLNKAQYGTNYFLMTLNMSQMSYFMGRTDDALSYLDEAGSIASELSSMSDLFSTYPIMADFMRGNLYELTGNAEADRLLSEGLEHVAGSEANDMMLVYMLDQYRIEGNPYSVFGKGND